MQKQVLFRDYQEQVSDDHNNIQAFTQEAVDTLVKDAVTNSRKFAGLTVTKTGQVEITMAPGRAYLPKETGDGEAVYARRTNFQQSLAAYLAVSSRRVVILAVFGAANLTDNESRDYIVDVETQEREPRAVDMTRSRDLVPEFFSGADSVDPVAPPVPATRVAVARIILDTTQIVSVEMLTENMVTSTDALDVRAKQLEIFRTKMEPRVDSIASDLASLQNAVGKTPLRSALARVFEDLARVKARLQFPAEAADYGADYFLGASLSDTEDTLGQGYDAKIEEGVRFPNANADQFEMSLFSANDPNATLLNGVLLPKWQEDVKINTGTMASSLGIAQYGFQTVEMKQGEMSRSRLRYGGTYGVCTNGNNWNTPGQPNDLTGLYDVESTGFVAVEAIQWDPNNWAHEQYRANTYWLDTWKEPFLYAVSTEHSISGAQVAQTFLASNDMWATRIGIYITAKAAAEDIHVAVCELVAGVPDLEKCLAKTVLPHADIVTGYNRIRITPSFLQKGKRYAVVLVSNANHQIGMASGQGYLNGTFFYSTDGIYYQGDLTKDMMLEIWGAVFQNAQVTVELAPINLDGGFRTIDVLANMWVPESTQLFFELRPNGSGEWLPLTPDNAAVLAAAPPLAQFRLRFVGTRDMHAAIRLTGSRVSVARPKTAFKHVSTLRELDTASDEIHVKVLLEGFDDTPHDHGCLLRQGSTNETPDATTTKTLDAAAGRYEREYVFNLAAPITEFALIQTGSTTSAQNTYHVAEATYYAI